MRSPLGVKRVQGAPTGPTHVVNGPLVLEGVVQVHDERAFGDFEDAPFTPNMLVILFFSDVSFHDSFHRVESIFLAFFPA